MRTTKKASDLNSGKIKIEKGIQIPDRIGTGRSKYPLSEMGKGDSFLIACESSEITRKITKQLNSATYNFQKEHGGKFVIRTVPEGVRVWKTK